MSWNQYDRRPGTKGHTTDSIYMEYPEEASSESRTWLPETGGGEGLLMGTDFL